MTQIDSGLVRELVYVESQALVRNSSLHPRVLLSKEDLSHCVRTSSSQRPCVCSQASEEGGVVAQFAFIQGASLIKGW